MKTFRVLSFSKAKGMVLAATLAAATIACTSALAAESANLVTVDNFHQVDTALFRSGRPSPDQLPAVAALGVKTILTLESYMLDPDDADAERDAALASGMAFERVEMSPLFFQRPSLDQIERALAIATDPSKQPVLVHCYHGSDRTGLVVGAYHIRVDGWSPDAAIADMRNFGHSSLYYWWDDILFDLPANP